MSRLPLPPGTYGKITTRQLPSGMWAARTQWRGRDGVKQRPSRRGATKGAAETALRKALAEMSTAASAGEITRNTRFREVAELWLEDIDYQAEHGSLSHNTARTYRSYLSTTILPRLGSLRMFEVTVVACDELIKHTRASMGYESAKKARSITGLVCGFAIRRGAIDINPIRSVERLTKSKGERVEVTAMTLEQIEKMLAGLRAYAETKEVDTKGRRQGWRNIVWHDLAELAEAMLATGVRIGEVLSLTGDDVGKDDKGNPYVYVRAHLVRVNGKGLVSVPDRKGGKAGMKLGIPPWSTGMFARRKLAAGSDPLFAARDGGWLDPSNTAGRLRAALDESGYDWVTSHVWRHTVATLLDEAGLSVSEIADQLGNTRQVAEKHYIKPRVTNTKAAAALQAIKRTAGGA